MSFDTAFEKTIGLEGGFSDNPNDNGNWTGGKKGVGELKGTKYGICAAQYPTLDIKNITKFDALAIYRRDYWNVLKIDGVKNTQIQEEIFDTGVNCGTGTAAKILQKSINFLEIGNPLVEDGAIGPLTIAKVNFWCQKDPLALFKVLNGFQFMRYYEITTANNTQEQFAYGWMKRIQDYRNS